MGMIGNYCCLLIETFVKLTKREFSSCEKKTVNKNYHASAQAIDKQGRKTSQAGYSGSELAIY
jgi:hypothetical protein